jgi:hypothetical protein
MFSMIRTIGRRSLPLVVALATLATAACGGDGDDSTTGPGPGPSTAEATVTVVNHAPAGTVLFLRYRPCGSIGWSSDLLGASTLGSGEQHAWNVAPGCYDVRATPGEIGLGKLYFNGVQVGAGEARTLEIIAFPAE